MKPIYLLCPHWIRTGGPEAIHQLSDALIEQGFDARLAYYMPPDIAGISEDEEGKRNEFICIPEEFPEYACPFEEWAHYKTKIVRSIGAYEPCVLVLPETMAHYAQLVPAHVTVLIWWLSVDNGFKALSKINLNRLRTPNVWHAAQSDYAHNTINTWGFRTFDYDDLVRHDVRTFTSMQGYFLLGDYTIDLSQFANPLPILQRPLRATINATPAKVIYDIGALVSRLGGGVECRIVGREPLDRRALAELFATSRVYVDLGNFPGNDRMAREALVMGCQVALNRVGGAELGSGHGEYVDANDMDSVVNTVFDLVRQPQEHARPRPDIRETEKRDFFGNVKAMFDILTGRKRNSHAA